MLRSLLPSFLLVLVYFIAEEFFGPRAGLGAAVVLGGGELIYGWFKFGRIDKATLWGTLVFIALGITEVVLEGSRLDNIRPAIIEGFMCALLGIFAFSKADITASLPESYRRTLQISPSQQQAMKRMVKILFFLLLMHLAVFFGSIFLLPEKINSFIGGPLLYILIGGFFLLLFVSSRIARWRAQHDEWLPVVNEKGDITGKAPRRTCHSGSRLLHPVVHLHIINPQGDIFLQKRSARKKLLPGKWDTAVGGHVAFGESIENALKREAEEELGITEFTVRFLGNYVWESQKERELVFSFICTSYNTININNEEVDEGRFWSRQELENPENESRLTPNFLHEYNRLLKRLHFK